MADQTAGTQSKKILAHMEVGSRCAVLVEEGTSYVVRSSQDGTVLTTDDQSKAYTAFMQLAERLTDLTNR